MAIFTDAGTLATLLTTDLLNYLDTQDDDERIDITDGEYCLGQRAATMLLTAPDGTAPYVSYGIAWGEVKGKDLRYSFRGSDDVAQFIGDMIDIQGDQEKEGGDHFLTVGFLRIHLITYRASIAFDEDPVALN